MENNPQKEKRMSEENKCPKCGASSVETIPQANVYKCGTFYLLGDLIRQTTDCQLATLTEKLEKAEELRKVWPEDVSISYEGVTEYVKSMQSKLEKLRKALETVLASAHPHPAENPAMFEAWRFASTTLEETK
jgi:hypothetical protein